MSDQLDRLEERIVDVLDGVEERLDELNDELDHGPVGRAIFKLGISISVIAIVLGALSIETSLGVLMLALGIVGLMGAVWGLVDHEPREWHE